MRVCKRGCNVKMLLLFVRLSPKHKFKKGFELKNSTCLLYLPISSSAEKEKETCEKNPYFGKLFFCKTRTDYSYKLCVQEW